MLKNIYMHRNFTELLAQKLADSPERGYRASLANAAGCQSAYFSQAVQGKVNFTLEHVFRMCAFWKLETQETEFALLLYHAERTRDFKLEQFYMSKIESIRIENQQLARQIGVSKSQALTESDKSIYYSSWHYSAVHVLISIPHLNTEAALAKKLSLPLSLVRQVAEDLIRFGIVKRNSKGLEVLQWNLHIDESNPLHVSNHLNWRIHCASLLQIGSQGHGFGKPKESTKVANLHYSAVHSLSRKDMEALRDLIVAFIKQARTIVSTSPEEEAIAMLIDFYAL